MDKLVLKGGAALRGTVPVSGSKNSSLPILAACLLTDEPCIVHRVPDLSDTRFMGEILHHLGADVSFANGTMRIEPALAIAAGEWCLTGGAPTRRFVEFEYQTWESWSRARRVPAQTSCARGRFDYKTGMVGKVYSSEKTQFRDPATGAEITQFTSVGRTNRTLYFTNRPYVCDGEHVVFLSDRTGRNEMFLLHVKTGQITQLTDLEGQSNVSNCIHPSQPELYFHNSKRLFRVRLDTLQTEELLRCPEDSRFGILNLNSPPWLAFEVIQVVEGMSLMKEGKPVPAKLNFEMHHQQPRTLIYRFHVDDGKLECVWGDYRLLTHVQISPTNPDLLIFSDWSGGEGRDRVWYLNLRKKIKSPARPLLGETQTSRGSHECFTRQGNLCLQWMEGDLQEDGQHQLMHAFKLVAGLPIEKVEQAPFRRYAIPESLGYLCHHYTMSEDEKWGVHDRWLTAPSFEENMSWLSVFRHQDAGPQTKVERLCFHNGHQGDRIGLGAELTIDDRNETALYTSFLGANANVCQVKLAPFVEKVFAK